LSIAVPAQTWKVRIRVAIWIWISVIGSFAGLAFLVFSPVRTMRDPGGGAGVGPREPTD
jgi:hypothetical protein